MGVRITGGNDWESDGRQDDDKEDTNYSTQPTGCPVVLGTAAVIVALLAGAVRG